MLYLLNHNFNRFPSLICCLVPYLILGMWNKTPITYFTTIIQKSFKKVKTFFEVQEKGSALTPSLKAKQKQNILFL